MLILDSINWVFIQGTKRMPFTCSDDHICPNLASTENPWLSVSQIAIVLPLLYHSNTVQCFVNSQNVL